MAETLTRIFSDIHYGDRASQVLSLSQLDPLLDGVDTLVLNGDTFDTRPGPYPERTAAQRADVEAYFTKAALVVVLMTGNHDPDLTTRHAHELADGRILVTHGDVLFDNIVPWSSEAALLHARVVEGRAALAPDAGKSLESQLALFRRVCATLPQRHQAEPNPIKYALRYLNDTVWPPTRMLAMFQAWNQAPELAAAIARAHRPRAKFIVLGHLHRPGIWPTKDKRVVINTGSFCRPLGAYVVDFTPGRLVVRRVVARRGTFHPGEAIAEFALAESSVSPTTTP